MSAERLLAEYRRDRRLTSDERIAMQTAVLRVVVETYEMWRAEPFARGRPEPKLTANYIASFLEQASYGQPRKFDAAHKKARANLVTSALATLKRQGEVLSTWGLGANGREARCWEPSYSTGGADR